MAVSLAPNLCHNQLGIWQFIVPTAHEGSEILIWPLAQVWGQTCAKGQIRIRPFIVPTAHEESDIRPDPNLAYGASFGQNLHQMHASLNAQRARDVYESPEI